MMATQLTADIHLFEDGLGISTVSFHLTFDLFDRLIMIFFTSGPTFDFSVFKIWTVYSPFFELVCF